MYKYKKNIITLSNVFVVNNFFNQLDKNSILNKSSYHIVLISIDELIFYFQDRIKFLSFLQSFLLSQNYAIIYSMKLRMRGNQNILS